MNIRPARWWLPLAAGAIALAGVACTEPRETCSAPVVRAGTHTTAAFPSDEALTAMLRKRIDEGCGVGVVVGLLEADGSTRIVVAGDAGDGARPLSARSVFEIGSITKVFTGTLLAEMDQRGDLSLTDPVSRHLPEGVRVPSRGTAQIRLLDLATQHSGLPRLPGNLAPRNRDNPYADYTAEQLYGFLASYHLPRDVGATFEYSNLGVGLLGHALAFTAGMSYEALVRERILIPLEMDDTGIGLHEDMAAWAAKGHNRSGDVVPMWDLPTLAGAGALRSNVTDMLRFLDANVGRPETDLERAMRTAQEQREELSSETSIGLSWLIQRVGDSRVVWHNGGTAGFRSFIGLDPEREIGVVVLANSAHSVDGLGMYLLNPQHGAP